MIYSISLTCPVCSFKFKNMKVKESKLRIVEMQADLFTIYRGEIHPLIYDAIVCPNCGNSALEDKFRTISGWRKQIITEKVTPNWSRQDYTKERTIEEGIVCFKLALYCAEITKTKKDELAGICLKIAWLYRMKKDKDENDFLTLAAKLYEKSYLEEESDMNELTLTYLVGEINRRLGNMEKASIWLERVISNPYIKDNPKIEKLAREQWNLVRDEMKKDQDIYL